jgi:hypothetical protein
MILDLIKAYYLHICIYTSVEMYKDNILADTMIAIIDTSLSTFMTHS